MNRHRTTNRKLQLANSNECASSKQQQSRVCVAYSKAKRSTHPKNSEICVLLSFYLSNREELELV